MGTSNVELLNMTPFPMQVIVLAARTCRASIAKSDSWAVHLINGEQVIDPLSMDIVGPLDTALVKRCIQDGHESILEHASFTFRFNMSRVAHMQQVRHRLISVSAESGRAVAVEDTEPFYLPESINKHRDIDGHPLALKIFWDTIDFCVTTCKTLVAMGVPVEDARYMLPMSLMQPMVVTANLREWRHILAERLCKHAQAEIREIAQEIRTALGKVNPLFVWRAEKLYRCKHKAGCSECAEKLVVEPPWNLQTR